MDKMRFTLKDRRLVHFAKEEVDEDRVEMPPGDNLGAGGLDRSLFSHLQRNWTLWLTKSYMGGVQSKRSVLFYAIHSFHYQRSLCWLINGVLMWLHMQSGIGCGHICTP